MAAGGFGTEVGVPMKEVGFVLIGKYVPSVKAAESACDLYDGEVSDSIDVAGDAPSDMYELRFRS